MGSLDTLGVLKLARLATLRVCLCPAMRRTRGAERRPARAAEKDCILMGGRMDGGCKVCVW